MSALRCIRPAATNSLSTNDCNPKLTLFIPACAQAFAFSASIVSGSASSVTSWECGGEPPHSQEVTLEADPETIEAEKAKAWAQAGINRVSFGLQSFVDKELVAAGRMHRRADIYRAVPILRD